MKTYSNLVWSTDIIDAENVATAAWEVYLDANKAAERSEYHDYADAATLRATADAAWTTYCVAREGYIAITE